MLEMKNTVIKNVFKISRCGIVKESVLEDRTIEMIQNATQREKMKERETEMGY